MRDFELELEGELEDLMSVLAESELESEAEMFAPAATGPIFDVALRRLCGRPVHRVS